MPASIVPRLCGSSAHASTSTRPAARAIAAPRREARAGGDREQRPERHRAERGGAVRVADRAEVAALEQARARVRLRSRTSRGRRSRSPRSRSPTARAAPSTERGRHGVAAITAPIRTTASSSFVLSQPASGAPTQATDSAFHAVHAASSPSGSRAGERTNAPGGRATASVSSRRGGEQRAGIARDREVAAAVGRPHEPGGRDDERRDEREHGREAPQPPVGAAGEAGRPPSRSVARPPRSSA